MLILFALFLQTPLPVANQDIPVFDFEVVAQLVSFNVKVHDKKKIIRNLKKKDFMLSENHLDINISNVSPTYLPRNLEILIDLSSSNISGLKTSKEICTSLIQNMAEKDRLRISAFSKIYLNITPFSSDRQLLLKGLDKLSERTSTALFDTISKALMSLSRENGPKALIILSDGRDLMSTISEDQLQSKVKTLGIPIFFIYSGTPPPSKAYLLVEQYQFLKNLVQISEGQWFEAEKGFSKKLKKMIQDVGFRYVLSYQPPQPENILQWRRRTLTIRNHETYRLSYSRGYQIKTGP